MAGSNILQEVVVSVYNTSFVPRIVSEEVAKGEDGGCPQCSFDEDEEVCGMFSCQDEEVSWIWEEL